MNSVVLIRKLWSQEAGQDIAEYAVMLAVILVLVVGTIRLVGSNANNAFSAVASDLPPAFVHVRIRQTSATPSPV
jgi:Flp pilus assembly pilin Flp